ncbi:ribosomal protein S14, mitochondrial-like isoform X2 [Xenia sp. Carnegie-2017]|nr:ribosomal protein S14, mitochondrial-like isoform X2 [Xenia sp. Carnegie-2017]
MAKHLAHFFGSRFSQVFRHRYFKSGIMCIQHPSFSLERCISISTSVSKYYVKPNYLKRWARRDQKRRDMFAEYEEKRGRLRMISKCDILPSNIRNHAATELAELPKDSSITRIRNRCVLTDRGRGVIGRFRISRIMFKYYAEKGLIAGVQRSQW